MPTKVQSHLADELIGKMHQFKSTRELYNYCVSPEFKSQVTTLEPDEISQLREDYSISMDFLRGKVKLDEMQNEIITVSSVTNGTSQYGTFLVLRGERENGNKFQALTSSVVIQRYFTPQILKELPVQIILHKEPFKLDDGKDVERWVVNRVNGISPNTQSELPW